METLSMTELYQRVSKRAADELVLDVRDPEEFVTGHVPGSRNVPYDQVEQHVDELRKYSKIYLYCRSGGRASLAMDALRKKGFKNLVCIGQGGIGDWISAGLPVER